MPTYLYECPTHGEFEEYHSMSKMLELCPKCQTEGVEPQKLKQLINCMSKGTVELYGQELIDQCKADGKKLAKEASKSEKIYSNLLGETNYNNLQTRLDNQKKNSSRR